MTAERPGAPEIEGLTYVRDLGAGGFADVYLYEQAAPARQVAVKVLRDATLSPRTVRNFRAEADAMAQLEHVHIVPVYATGTTRDNRPYIVMKFYAHDTLATRARTERFTVAETLQLGIQLGSAIETAHRAGLLHKDIKPANILVDSFGKCALTDFGIAGQVTDADDPETGVSVPWSPPETLYGGPASFRSDVYSLAATLWHLLVGRSPFEIPGGDNSPFALMKRVRDVPPPSTGRGDVPPSLDRLLRAGLSKDAARRPGSALEFIGALQAIEQELRLPATQSVLARTPASSPLPPTPLADATQLRAPRVVRPDAPVSPPGPASGAASEAATMRRGALPGAITGYDAGVVGPTQVRGSAVPPVQPDVIDTPVRPGRGRLVAVAAVLVVLVVGVGWLLLRDQRPARAASEATVSPPPPAVVDRVPPGKPEVTASRAGDLVAFTWTYASALPDDQVVWRVAGTTATTTAGPTGKAEVSNPSQVCIELQVHRLDGSFSPGDTWTKKCA